MIFDPTSSSLESIAQGIGDCSVASGARLEVVVVLSSCFSFGIDSNVFLLEIISTRVCSVQIPGLVPSVKTDPEALSYT